MLLTWVAVNSCSSSEDNRTLISDPDFVGFFSAIDHYGSGDVVGHITVESHANKLVRRHIVTLNRQTALLRREDGTLHPVELASFKPKDWVKVWFSGRRKETYPVDTTARQIVIVDHL